MADGDDYRHGAATRSAQIPRAAAGAAINTQFDEDIDFKYQFLVNYSQEAFSRLVFFYSLGIAGFALTCKDDGKSAIYQYIGTVNDLRHRPRRLVKVSKELSNLQNLLHRMRNQMDQSKSKRYVWLAFSLEYVLIGRPTGAKVFARSRPVCRT